MDFEAFRRNGYFEIEFSQKSRLNDIQRSIESVFPCWPTEWHTQRACQDDHIALVKKAQDELARTDLVTTLVDGELNALLPLLGPDIDIQSIPLLRISRPSHESDFVDWHRDSFYGNLPHELNLWFPVYPLRPGAGLMLVEGSHVVPSRNIRVVSDDNEFRKTIEKGSVANKLGYAYSPKTDDAISNKDPRQIKLIAPPWGHGVVFFGCMVHRAQNQSDETRLSIDARLRNAYTRTEINPGYYKALCRGIVDNCSQQFLTYT